MRSFLFFAVIVSIFHSINLSAQSLRETEFTHYTRIEGLSNNYISGIVQDSTGYIWVSTHRGLNRFDGRFFANYYSGSADLPMPDNMIKQMRMQGREIIGTTIMGSFAYNTSSRKGIVLIVPSDSLIFGWTNNIAETIRDSKGHYVLSSTTGLYILDSNANIVDRYDNFKPSDARSKELIFGNGLSALNNGMILQDNVHYFSAYDPKTNNIDTFYGLKNPEFKKAISDSSEEPRTSFPGGKTSCLS